MERRKELIENIRAYSFGVLDAAMFLDINPDDQQALDYYKKYRDLREKELAEYQRNYGPLTIDGNYGDTWNWVMSPWPWEGEV